MPPTHPTIRRLLPHQVRALVPRRFRRLARRWIRVGRSARRAAHLSSLSIRAEQAAADERWLDEAQLLESVIDSSAGASPHTFARLAKVYRLSGDLERALDVIHRGLVRYRTNVRIASEFAQHAMAREDWDDAVRRWQAVIDMAEEPPRPSYLARLGAAEAQSRHASGWDLPRELDATLTSVDVETDGGDPPDESARSHPVGGNGVEARAPSRAYARLALACRRQGDFLAAELALERGLNKHPNDARLATAFAENASQLRDWAAAVDRWEAVLGMKRGAASTRTFVELARAHQMLGDLSSARSVLDRGIDHAGEHPTLLTGKAKLAMAERQWGQAVNLWKEVLRHRGTPKTYRGFTRAYAGQNDYVSAWRILEEGRDQHPLDPTLSVEAIFLLIAQGRWEDAKSEWERQLSMAVDISADQYVALSRRSSVNFHHDLADAFIEHALELYPDDIGVKRQAVRNALTRERRQRPPREWNWDAALQRAKHLAEMSPRSETEDVHLGVAYELTEGGALNEAREVLRSHVEDGVGSALVWGELFTLAMAQGEWEEAAGHLRAKRAVLGTLDTRDSIGLARACSAAGEYDAALEVLGDPSESSPSYAQVRIEAALVASTAGRLDAAIEALESLLQVRGGHVPEAAYRRLATAYQQVGEEHAARRVVANARERLGPGAVEANPGVVAIIGGGPSLRGVDLEPLRGVAHCVAVNAAAMALPWSDVAVTHDVNHLAERFHGFPGPVVVGASPEFVASRGKLRGFELRRRIVTDRLSELDEVLHSGGHTSAHTALGYAYLLRPKRIVIFGVDLTDFWGPDEYWHEMADQYNRKGFEERKQRAGFEVWEEYRRQKLTDAPNVFASTVPQLQRQGVDVVNASPESAVRCFPRVDPAEGIERCVEGVVLH